MNPKLLFVLLLGAAALGYYAYDPELTHIHKMMGTEQSKTVRASKVKPAKARAKKARPAAEETPAAAPAAEPAAPAPQAAPAAEEPARPQLAAPGSARVADVLATLPLVRETTPNTNARYYIYLMSAGWCGPCNMEMPNVVKAYEEIKASGVAEIILVDFDDSPENARAYMDKYGATFPAIMQEHAPSLPGIQPPGGIPSAIIVDETGNHLVSGHGAIISDWKKHITEYEEKNALPLSITEEPAADSPEPAAGDEPDADKNDKKKKSRAAVSNVVARSVAKVKWENGRPNRKAKYYIYLQSASWCGPCRAEMPTIAEEYKAMKKDGRVELLLVSFDQTESAAKKFLSSNKATFPMTMKDAKGVQELAGFTMAQGIPTAIIVNAAGEVVTQGHGAIIRNWRQFTIDKEDKAED